MPFLLAPRAGWRVSAPTAVMDYESAAAAIPHSKAVGIDVPAGTYVVNVAQSSSVTATITMSDSKSNTWTAVPGGPFTTGGTGNTARMQAFTSRLATALVPTDTVTVNSSVSGSVSWIMFSLTGVNLGAPIEVAATATVPGAASTAWSSPAVTPKAGALAVAFGSIGGTGSVIASLTAGWTQYLRVTNTARAMAVVYQQAVTSTSMQAAGTITSNPWVGVSMVFGRDVLPPSNPNNQAAIMRATTF